MRLLDSAKASLPVEPSGPGTPDLAVLRRADVGEAVAPRPRSTASSARPRWPGPGGRPAAAFQILHRLADRAGALRRRSAPPIDTRSFMSVVSDTRQPSPGSPRRSASGMRTSVKYTSLNSASPVIWRSGRVSTPGACMSTTKAVRPGVLGHVRVGAHDEQAPAGDVGQGGPHLLAVDDPLVAVAHALGRQAGEVGAGAGLGEQLAPDLLAGEQRAQVPLLLRRRCPTPPRSARTCRSRSGCGSRGWARRRRRCAR